MTKVLEIFGEPISSGGQESFVINVLSHMDRTNMKIDLLTPYYCDNDYYKQLVLGMGGEVFTLELPFRPGQSRMLLKKPIESFLRNHDYDVVHIHSGSISVLAICSWVAHSTGVKKVIVHSHCAAERETLKHQIVKLAFSPMLTFGADIYCACGQAAGECKYSANVVHNKLVILKNGIDLNRFSFNIGARKEMRRKIGASEETLVVGQIGRFSYQKNQEYSIDVFEKVHQIDSESKLVLVGDGEQRGTIYNLVKQKKLEDAVVFTGNVNDVENYLQAMDILVMPSRFEGLPIVGVEAQGIGIPLLVSSNVSRELAITDNVTYLSLENQDNWVKAILERPERKSNYSEIIESGYDINMTASAVRTLYLE